MDHNEVITRFYLIHVIKHLDLQYHRNMLLRCENKGFV
jgi:hypothetical protein